MNGNKCILDTSVIIHAFRNNNEILSLLRTFDEVWVSTTATGELYFGAFASENPQKHINQIAAFLTDCIIIAPDHGTSIVYGQLKAGLKKKGTPVPENDIWIAAMAADLSLPLFTTDKHFESMNIDLVPLK